MSTFTTDRTLAELELNRTLGKAKNVYQGRGKPPKVTYGQAHKERFQDAAHSENTMREAETWLERIGEDTLCEDVDWEMVQKLVRVALRPGFKQSTLRRGIVQVKATLMWAHQNFGLKRGCPAPCFPRISSGGVRQFYINPAHAVAMVHQLFEEGHLMVAQAVCIALGEGPRRGELYAMSFPFIDLEIGTITFPNTKSRGSEYYRERLVSDPRPSTIGILSAIKSRRKTVSDAVFTRQGGAPFASSDTFGRFINQHLRRVAKDVGVPFWEEVTLHVLRHTAATNHYLLTGDMLEVKRRFDWDDSDSAERYIKAAPKQLALQVAQMYGLADIWQSPHALVRYPEASVLYLLDKSARPRISPLVATPLARERLSNPWPTKPMRINASSLAVDVKVADVGSSQLLRDHPVWQVSDIRWK